MSRMEEMERDRLEEFAQLFEQDFPRDACLRIARAWLREGPLRVLFEEDKRGFEEFAEGLYDAVVNYAVASRFPRKRGRGRYSTNYAVRAFLLSMAVLWAHIHPKGRDFGWRAHDFLTGLDRPNSFQQFCILWAREFEPELPKQITPKLLRKTQKIFDKITEAMKATAH